MSLTHWNEDPLHELRAPTSYSCSIASKIIYLLPYFVSRLKVFGITIIILSGILLSYKEHSEAAVHSLITRFAIIGIVNGIFSIINGILGSYGSIKEHLPSLIAHLVFLSLAILFQLIQTVLGFSILIMLWFLLSIIRLVHASLLLHIIRSDSSGYSTNEMGK